jgi:CheY-like chemotaxis protein
VNTPSATHCHILIVDDEPLVRQTVQMVLELGGHSVAQADDGPHALAQFEPGKFDHVLTDYYMPSMTGGQLATAIKQRSPGQHVVMLTAYPEKVRTPGGPLKDVDLLIGKPFEIETLLGALAQCTPVPKPDSAI